MASEPTFAPIQGSLPELRQPCTDDLFIIGHKCQLELQSNWVQLDNPQYTCLLELAVTAGTGIDVADPDSPTTNAFHHSETLPTTMEREMASQYFEMTILTFQFHGVL